MQVRQDFTLVNQVFLVLAQMVGVIEGSDSLKIEIKCPYSAWDLEVEKACTKSNFYCTLDNGEFHLSRNHKSTYWIFCMVKVLLTYYLIVNTSYPLLHNSPTSKIPSSKKAKSSMLITLVVTIQTARYIDAHCCNANVAQFCKNTYGSNQPAILITPSAVPLPHSHFCN